MSEPIPAENDECTKALARLYKLLDGELDTSDADDVRAHLDACEPCMDIFEAENAMKRLVKRGCCGDAAPEHLRIRVMSMFTSETQLRTEIRDT